MFFGRNLGNITSLLVFDNEPSFSFFIKVLNISVLVLIGLIFFIISKKRFYKLYSHLIFMVLCLSVILFCLSKIIKINTQVKDICKTYEKHDTQKIQIRHLPK